MPDSIRTATRLPEGDSLPASGSEQTELRFILCGSVDDGKSTLLGRLLHDSRNVFDDQLATVEAESRVHGTRGEALDLALLVDGLQAEREQGITIGELVNFTGIDSPYEPPENPELHIDTTRTSIEQAAERIIAFLQRADASAAANNRSTPTPPNRQ